MTYSCASDELANAMEPDDLAVRSERLNHGASALAPTAYNLKSKSTAGNQSDVHARSIFLGRRAHDKTLTVDGSHRRCPRQTIVPELAIDSQTNVDIDVREGRPTSGCA
jgi:hypothetical protein